MIEGLEEPTKKEIKNAQEIVDVIERNSEEVSEDIKDVTEDVKTAGEAVSQFGGGSKKKSGLFSGLKQDLSTI
jgi:methyl-accepting chemotaxis protein